MKTLFATLAAASILTAAAVPAAAQPYGSDHGRYERGWDGRHQRGGDAYDLRGRSLGRIALTRVGRAIDDRAVSPWEGRRLRAQAYDLYQTEARIGGNGLDWRERRMIEDRFQRLMAQLDRDIRDRDYGSGYYR